MELVPDKIRKVTGRYPEATFAKKCNLRARAHLVTVDALPRKNTCHKYSSKRGAKKMSLLLVPRFPHECFLGGTVCNFLDQKNTKNTKNVKTLSPGRYPEGPGRVSGSEPGRIIFKTR